MRAWLEPQLIGDIIREGTAGGDTATTIQLDSGAGTAFPANGHLKGVLRPVHPGEMLRDRAAGARQTSRCESASWSATGLWLAMQQYYDLEIAERALAKELKAIPTLQAAE